MSGACCTTTLRPLARRSVVVLDHLPYSSDLAPPDLFLFPKNKFYMKGERYDSVDAIKNAVTSELKLIAREAFVLSFAALY